MNGSVQRTIPNVMLPFRSMIPKSRSAAYYGSGEEAERLGRGSTSETLAKEWVATVPR